MVSESKYKLQVPSGHAGATESLVHPVPIKLGQNILSKDALLTAASERQPKAGNRFPGTCVIQGTCKCSGVIQFYNHQVWITGNYSKLRQKIYNRSNPDSFQDKDGDSNI